MSLGLLSIPSWSDFNYTRTNERNSCCFSFQSHLGLISTITLPPVFPIKIQFSFNPILVWFQLSSFLMRLTIEATELSIPSWSDFNRCFNRYRVFACILSIPSWSDFNYKKQHAKYAGPINLSIPSWSDFNHNKDIVLWHGQKSFNPILVWFQQEEQLELLSEFELLSIPSWSDFNLITVLISIS